MILKHPFTLINPLSVKYEDKESEKEKLDRSLKETIDKSIADVDKELNKEEKKEEKQEDKKEEKTEEKEETQEEELNEEDIKTAKDLLRALKDPNVAPSVIQAMAAAAGVKLENIKTEKQEEKAIKTITDLVKEEFGNEFPLLGEKLGKILEKFVPKIVEEQTKEIREKAENREIKEVRSSLETALTETFESYKNVDEKIQKKVYELVDEIPIKPGSDPKTYFNRLTKIAADELNVTLVKKDNKTSEDTETRRERNRNDAQNKLRSKDLTEEKDVSKVKSGDMSLAEAIRKGMEEAEELLAKK